MKISHANLSRTIIYGTVATRIENSTDGATHSWKVFVRGYNNTDISYFIRSITFKTHETFANPTRNVDTLPFEIEERGWGEFTIQAKIYFVNAHERPIAFTINLKLHHDPQNKVIGDVEYDDNAIVNERLDTIIFETPTEGMYKILKNKKEPEIEGIVLEQIKKEKDAIERAIEFMLQRLKKDTST